LFGNGNITGGGHLDSDVGAILNRLKQRGLEENTIVVLTSDNGTTHLDQEVDYDLFKSVGELLGLKGHLHEGGVRVSQLWRPAVYDKAHKSGS